MPEHVPGRQRELPPPFYHAPGAALAILSLALMDLRELAIEKDRSYIYEMILEGALYDIAFDALSRADKRAGDQPASKFPKD